MEKTKQKIEHTPTCFVCKGNIKELIEINEMKEAGLAYTDSFHRAVKRLGEKVVCVGFDKEGDKILRHTGFCEPGAKNYMRDPELRKGYNEMFIQEGARRRTTTMRRRKVKT